MPPALDRTLLEPHTPVSSPSKRKRSESISGAWHFEPRIKLEIGIPKVVGPLYLETQVDGLEREGLQASGANSPRTTVANTFAGLKIQEPLPVLSFGGTGEAERKKAKIEDKGHFAVGPERIGGLRGIPHTTQGGVMGIGVISASEKDIVEDLKPFPTAAASTSKVRFVARRPKSPPPPASTEFSPYTGSSASSPDVTALTWQDSEITGHLVMPGEDPDDDGTGINGIGFKPTPAMAYARSQRRRKQVMEWRAREAREERQRRSERRRGLDAKLGGGGSDRRRMVRFA